MKSTEEQIQRELQLSNLSWAARMGLDKDPRWQAAMDRIREEQEAEVRESLRAEEAR
jgi:hypothetical protein